MRNQTFTITLPESVIAALEGQAALQETTAGKYAAELLGRATERPEWADVVEAAASEHDPAAEALAWSRRAYDDVEKSVEAHAVMYQLAQGQLQATLAVYEQLRLANKIALVSAAHERKTSAAVSNVSQPAAQQLLAEAIDELTGGSS